MFVDVESRAIIGYHFHDVSEGIALFKVLGSGSTILLAKLLKAFPNWILLQRDTSSHHTSTQAPRILQFYHLHKQSDSEKSFNVKLVSL